MKAPKQILVEKFRCSIEDCEKFRVWVGDVGMLFYSEDAASRYLWEQVKP